jgi:hypothetical protein
MSAEVAILVNQIGYELDGPKRALVALAAPAPAAATGPGGTWPGGTFHIVDEDGGPAFEGLLRREGEVPGWRGRRFASAEFGALARPGRYVVRVGNAESAPFEIGRELLLERTLGAVLGYLRSQRCRDPWDSADRQCAFFGGGRAPVDVHGGWHDASGDVSKYLSHLSYANFMNPQQTPIVVWNLLWAEAILPARHAELRRRLAEEAVHGGDFLVRMLDPEGYFYTTVFDRWSKQLGERDICTYETQKGIKNTRYKAGWRQGAGAAIAALARLAASGHRGEKSADDYLAAAERGFAHVDAHGRAYLDDGRENIIDDDCALLAAAELFGATRATKYADAARRRAASLSARLATDAAGRGYWRADDGTRPYFHAVEAGLPALALLRWAELTDRDEDRAPLRAAAATSLAAELALTDEVPNPFGYARQLVVSPGGAPRTSFFFPHVNESGYWWQGENARLGSLAAAATRALAVGAMPAAGGARERLRRYAHDQLDWILGKNPFDACMLHGFGRGNVNYQTDWPNVHGGIYNGVTGGYADETDIDFAPPTPAADGDHGWRWTEQWIPHAAWYILAVASLGA